VRRKSRLQEFKMWAWRNMKEVRSTAIKIGYRYGGRREKVAGEDTKKAGLGDRRRGNAVGYAEKGSLMTRKENSGC
jgi:hypothetical protein